MSFMSMMFYVLSAFLVSFCRSVPPVIFKKMVAILPQSPKVCDPPRSTHQSHPDKIFLVSLNEADAKIAAAHSNDDDLWDDNTKGLST